MGAVWEGAVDGQLDLRTLPSLSLLLSLSLLSFLFSYQVSCIKRQMEGRGGCSKELLTGSSTSGLSNCCCCHCLRCRCFRCHIKYQVSTIKWRVGVFAQESCWRAAQPQGTAFVIVVVVVIVFVVVVFVVISSIKYQLSNGGWGWLLKRAVEGQLNLRALPS